LSSSLPFSMLPPHPPPTLFPYTTLFRSTVPLAKLGINPAVGDGTQYIPWIDIRDLVNLYDFIIKYPQIRGVFNAVSSQHLTMNRSEEHRSELQSRENLVCRLLLENKTCSQASRAARIAGSASRRSVGVSTSRSVIGCSRRFEVVERRQPRGEDQTSGVQSSHHRVG